jgi:hypothetical protein
MWGLHLGALGALTVYLGVRTPAARRKAQLALRWVPFAMVLLGTLLVLFDLTRHMLLDQNLFGKQLHMFNPDGRLTAVGLFGQVATWIGLALVIVGTGWFVGYEKKIYSMLVWCRDKLRGNCTEKDAEEEKKPV